MVRMLRDAIILSKLKEQPRTKEQIAISMNIDRSNIERSIRAMKRSGLVKGRGHYFLTNKGETHFYSTIRKIDRRRV